MKWDEMTARERDALVATEVMGHVDAHAPVGDGLSRTHDFGGASLEAVEAKIKAAYPKALASGRLWPAQYCGPHYTTSIACAWEVVEKMREEGWLVRVQEKPDDIWWDEGNAIARAYCLLSWMKRETTEGARKAIHEHPRGMADTTPEAICKAALRAKGVDL